MSEWMPPKIVSHLSKQLSEEKKTKKKWKQNFGSNSGYSKVCADFSYYVLNNSHSFL